MRRIVAWPAILCLPVLFSRCGAPPEAARAPAPAPGVTKEALYHDGHQRFLLREYDSAAVLLERVRRMDPAYRAPLEDLASLWYERAKEYPAGPAREVALKKALDSFAALEETGARESEIYERLCEVAVALNDDRSFLVYAKKNAEKYPFDRQYYNLGLASFEGGEYAETVRNQKEAVAKFPRSNYLAGFYRQMARAYMKMDRDQTAERTLTAGVAAADARLAELRREPGGREKEEGIKRLTDDRIGMLLLLKRLHMTYKDQAKLERVEKLLKEAGK